MLIPFLRRNPSVLIFLAVMFIVSRLEFVPRSTLAINWLVLLAVDFLGISLTALTVFSGAFGLAIGFGLQKTFGNLISGIILLMDRSIKPGDVIAVGEGAGKTVGRPTAVGPREPTRACAPRACAPRLGVVTICGGISCRGAASADWSSGPRGATGASCCETDTIPSRDNSARARAVA